MSDDAGGGDGDGDAMVPVADVPAADTLLVTLHDRADDADVEAILVDTDEGIRAWRNYCQHLTHIPLDKGSGAPVRNGEVLCANHGAMFAADSGLCTHGPCEGATLEAVAVRVADGTVYLDDEGYAFVERGGTEDDGDLSSESNVIL